MKAHLEKIDFLRGVAILLVFVYHASLVIFGSYYKTYTYSDFWLNYGEISKINMLLMLSPASFGGTGVSLFLIISGFLIHYATLGKDLKFKSAEFYNKRFWRIYPPYLLVLLVFIFSLGLFNGKNLLYHLFLIHNFNDQTIYSINPSFWSLALEAQLYIIYPLYLFLYKKLGNKRSFICILIFTLISLIVQKVFNITSESFDKSIFRYWIIWVAGAFLADVFFNKKRILRLNGYHIVLFFLLIILLQFSIIYIYIGLYLWSFFYILFVDWFLHNKAILLNGIYKATISIGICSYSIYLFHQPYLYELINYVRFGFYSFLITAPLCFLFLYLIAQFTYKYVELPSVLLGKKLFSWVK